MNTYNLFEDALPKFDGNAVGAKMAVFTGGEANSVEKAAWQQARLVFDRFAAAETYVFNVPLWNSGIPYVLKQFVDVVTQPGWAFKFDPDIGYTGLLAGKKAYVVHASGIYKMYPYTSTLDKEQSSVIKLIRIAVRKTC